MSFYRKLGFAVVGEEMQPVGKTEEPYFNLLLDLQIDICEDVYEGYVMRECALATVRRSVFNLCFLYVSSDIQGLERTDG